MNEIYSTNIKTFDKSKSKAIDLINNLKNLSYFDKTNYEKNNDTLQFSLVKEDESNIFEDGQYIFYDAKSNTIYIKEEFFDMGLIDENFLTMLLVHELIHMSSTNRDKNTIGFKHDAAPITYDDSCVQYLTLKLYYGDVNEEVLNNNPLYNEGARSIKKSVDALGEDVVFNGFFESDFKKNVDALSPRTLDKWIDYVMEIDQSLEEKMTRERLGIFKEQPEELQEMQV